MEKVNLDRIENTNIIILLQTAEEMGIKYQILDWLKYKIKLTKGGKTHLVWKKSMGINSPEAIKISRDKHLTYLTLKQAGLAVLKQFVVKNIQDYQQNYEQIPFPQVIKPLYGEKGKNIYLNIKNKKQGLKTVKDALKYTPALVVEPYFTHARDYRFIVLNNQLIGLAERRPPQITADGKHNIKQLINLENEKRVKLNQKLGRRMLNRMLIWKRIKWYLKQQNLTLNDVPEKNKIITLYPLPNFSTGGSVETVGLDQIHSGFIDLSLKTAKAIGLCLIGIDVLAKDIKQTPDKNNCCIIEVNSDPGLRLHEWPNRGKPQKVAQKILKYIFSNPSLG